LWAGAPVSDSVSGAGLADSVRAQLGAAYGGRDTSGISFFGAAFWVAAGRYHRGELAAFSGFEAPPLAGPDSAAPPRHVFGFAWLPASGIDPSQPGLAARTWSPPDTLPLDSAVRVAGLDSALWRPLGAIDARVGDPDQAARRAPAPADSLVRPLRRWVEAAAALPPPRRAAALYAADRVLERAQCHFRLCQRGDSAALAPLRALGAQFGFSELSGTWVYQRTWLTQARALDRDSPLGQRVLLTQLAHAFDFSGTCAGGPEGFRAVIENGERYLERVADGPIAAEVHYLVAEAYRDVLALAAGEGDIYADAAAYAAEAGDAARQALRHYDAAARLGRGRAVAGAAWQRAWWLRAGLPPRGLRSYCIYD
jgi:hypothetical protein